MTDTSGISILELLPQRPDFLFVDRMDCYTEDGARTSYTVPEDGFLIGNGELTAAGLTEHMAQSCAARTGYVSKYILKVPVTIGFIGQVRNLEIKRFPRCGETLCSEVRIVEEIFGITLSQVTVRSGGELVASATLKTVKKEGND